MRIGIDIRSLIEPFPSGVSVYTEQLLRAMVRIGSEHSFHLFCSGMVPIPHSIREWAARQSNVTLTHIRRPNKLSNSIHIAIGRPYLDRMVGGVDIWFTPNMMFGRVSPSVPVVLTVHDVSFLYPKFFSRRGRWWHRLVRPGQHIRRAQHIISVSENTKRDIITTYGISSERITVVPLGINRASFTAATQESVERIRDTYHLERPYVLSVGTVNPRKNIDGLIDAWQLLTQKTHGAYDLVIAGHAGRRLGERLPPRVRFVEYIPEADKPAWYHGAAAFVYPSFLEGFGLPVLEAMASHVPVVISTAPALGEVAGDAALMVDPYNAAALAEGLFRILQDQQLRRQLIARGTARVSRYSWEDAAQQTLSMLISTRV